MSVAVYALLDERGRIRYVGRSADPETRLRQHLADRGRSPKAGWLEEMRRRGERPAVRVLEWVELGDAPAVELRWIRRLRAAGLELTNVMGAGRPRRPGTGFSRPQRSPLELLALAREFLRVPGPVAGAGAAG